MEFKDNLKRIREDRKLTQEFVADEIGISRQSVSKWEKGLSEPDIDTLKKLCQILNCKITDLIEEPKVQKDKRINKIFIYKSLFIIGMVFAIAFIVFAIIFVISVVNHNNFYVEAKTAGLDGVGGFFSASEYNTIAYEIGEKAGASDPLMYGSTLINANYYRNGDVFWFKGLNPENAQINWTFMILMIVFGIVCSALLIVSTLFKKQSTKKI